MYKIHDGEENHEFDYLDDAANYWLMLVAAGVGADYTTTKEVTNRAMELAYNAH